MTRIGVLALQGGFHAHLSVLRSLGHEAVEVRSAIDLAGVEGLVLPGGESTAQLSLLSPGLRAALDRLRSAGAPVLATCAGAVVAVELGWLDAQLRRNAYGSQLHSSEGLADDGTPIIMIRAPRFESLGPAVEVITSSGGEPVLVRSGALLAATFHPELADDLRVHKLAFGAPRRAFRSE